MPKLSQVQSFIAALNVWSLQSRIENLIISTTLEKSFFFYHAICHTNMQYSLKAVHVKILTFG